MNKIEPGPVLQDRFLDHPYALGGRVIDPVLGTLSWQGQIERLRRKELEVLALLASADGAVVSRQAFIDVIWDGNNLVGDQAITVAISSLRQALRDSQSSHPLIRTIPRRGYQLSESALQPPPGIAPAPVTESAPDVLAVLPTPEIKPDALPAPESAPLFQPGDTIPGCPGWRLTRRLSEPADQASAISESWLAEASEFNSDEHTQARVFRFCRSEAQLRRLQREVTLLRYVNQSLAEHPGFAVIRDWQLDEPPYYLARDYAKYGSLVEWAGACAAPTPPLALMAQLSDALAALHALGVVHRNVKADRILVDETGAGPQFKISALGLGALSDRSKLAPLQITALGLTMGAEEAQAHATTADDVAALGLVFLQLTLGDWQALPTENALAQVTDGALQNLLRRCVGPTDLRPTAAALAQQLRAVLTPKSGEATPAPLAAQTVPQTVPAPLAASGPVANQPTPESIGPYRLLDQLGEGGMGMVYLAEQRDPYRKVALKIIRSGLDGKQILSRFDAERQALAMMNHPNVASVHDSGLAADGRPFFAMEYIAGEDITKYCDAHHLNLPARIKLFLQVCDGVLHAHQKGVLHRDIKPSNLMVSHAPENAGTVKVIDFGLAKSLHGKLATQTLHTSFGAFIGTPIYSSPEHVSGAASGVDTRSDIYSMGVVLYELLAGMTPIASASLENLEPEKVRELVCRSKLPSMREQLQNTSAEKRKELAEHRAIKVDELPKTLEGDLSWVVGKCLERDPNDRYASVLELKKDLERWLALRPVEARPTSGWYRFQKLVRRHRRVSILVAASVTTILLTTTAAIFGYLRAERALETSRLAEAEATAAADFQVKQMQGVDPAAMGLTLREQLIEAVQKRTTERGWEPAAITQGQQQLSTLLEGVNFTDLSLGQLDKHQFQPTLASISKDFKDQPLLQARLWQSLADSLEKLGRIDAAFEPQRLALEQRQRLLGDDDPLTLVSRRRLGVLLKEKGRFNEAEAELRMAMAGMRRIKGNANPETLESQLELIRPLLQNGHMEDALTNAQELLKISRETLGADHPITIQAFAEIGTVLRRQQKFSEAERFMRGSVEQHQRIYGSGYRDTSIVINNLAVLLMDTGRYAEAEALLLPLVAQERARLGSEHPGTLRQLGNLSAVLSFQGRYVEAEEIIRMTLEVQKRMLGEDDAATFISAVSLQQLLLSQGKIDEGIALGRQLLSISRRKNGGEDSHSLHSTTVLAQLLQQKGESNEANVLMRHVLQTRQNTLGTMHRSTLATIVLAASLAEAQNDLHGAETLLREALAGQRKTFGKNRDTMDTIDQLATVLRVRGKLDEALKLGQEAIEMATDLGPTGQRRISLYQNHQARTLTDLRRFDDAEELLGQAKSRLSQDTYPWRKSVEALAEGYIELYAQRQKTQPELGFDTKALPWQRKLDLLKNEPSRLAAEILKDP